MALRPAFLSALLLGVPASAPPAAGDDGAAAAITGRLEGIRAKAKLPALGGAIVTSAGLEGAWVTGLRAEGHPEPVELGDRWHIGSCTKSMTATLIALLVERGDLDWEMKLPELLPDLAASMHDGYVDVTLVELLCHRAGVPADLGRDGLWSRCWRREGTHVEQRRMLARTVLGWGPVHAPRAKYLYSNAGIAIAGHAAESVAGRPFEELMQELLFEPLGITTAGFGAPGTTTSVDQPRGHGGDGRPVEPGPQADNPPAIAPAGTCHLSLADWGRYASLHLRGAKGDVKVGEITLRAETTARLHAPYAGPGERYAMGWGVARRDWAGGDGTVLTHNGSNTMWYSVIWMAPDPGFAVLVATNRVGTTGQEATDAAAAMLIGEHRARTAARPQPPAR